MVNHLHFPVLLVQLLELLVFVVLVQILDLLCLRLD